MMEGRNHGWHGWRGSKNPALKIVRASHEIQGGHFPGPGDLDFCRGLNLTLRRARRAGRPPASQAGCVCHFFPTPSPVSWNRNSKAEHPIRLSAQCQPHRSNPALEFRAQETFHAVMSNPASLASTLLTVRMSLPTSYGFAIAAQNPNLRQSRMTGSES